MYLILTVGSPNCNICAQKKTWRYAVHSFKHKLISRIVVLHFSTSPSYSSPDHHLVFFFLCVCVCVCVHVCAAAILAVRVIMCLGLICGLIGWILSMVALLVHRPLFLFPSAIGFFLQSELVSINVFVSPCEPQTCPFSSLCYISSP